MTETLALTKALIQQPSVTPDDAGCMDLISQRLQKLDFVIQRLPFDEVDNLWAICGSKGPLTVFLGHTDVVPPGELNNWESPPFQPTIRDGNLYGRGSADMKGSVAAMITACERFFTLNPTNQQRFAFLLTSDEEGPAINGTQKVINYLNEQNIHIDYCLVGEPSSKDSLGDTIKNGRRGSLNGTLVLKGQQGHIAYPHLAINPIEKCPELLQALFSKQWDQGHPDFSATQFQISNIQAGVGATNVIPGELTITFNFRFSPSSTVESLQQQMNELIKDCYLFPFDIDWTVSALPFLTPEGNWLQAIQTAILKVTGRKAIASTSGGTSDGRFVAPTGSQVVELGPINASIHQYNEHVNIEDLESLSTIYEEILQQILNKPTE